MARLHSAGTIQSSGSFTAVALQQAAEPLFAFHFSPQQHSAFALLPLRLRSPAAAQFDKRLIVHCLVRPLHVVVLEPLGNQVVEVPLAQDHEVVEALLLNRLDEPFDIGVGVRRADRRTPSAKYVAYEFD